MQGGGSCRREGRRSHSQSRPSSPELWDTVEEIEGGGEERGRQLQSGDMSPSREQVPTLENGEKKRPELMSELFVKQRLGW